MTEHERLLRPKTAYVRAITALAYTCRAKTRAKTLLNLERALIMRQQIGVTLLGQIERRAGQHPISAAVITFEVERRYQK